MKELKYQNIGILKYQFEIKKANKDNDNESDDEDNREIIKINLENSLYIY